MHRMWSYLQRKMNNQSGFTAIELLAAIALTGIIGGAIAMGITQTFSGNMLSNNQKTAINNVRNAGDWLVRDVQQAQPNASYIFTSAVEADEGNFRNSGALVNLEGSYNEIRFIWYDYDSTDGFPDKNYHVVVYTIPADSTNLTRSEGEGENFVDITPGPAIVIARNITGVSRAFEETVVGTIPKATLMVEVTAEVGTDSNVATETRTFEVQFRSEEAWEPEEPEGG